MRTSTLRALCAALAISVCVNPSATAEDIDLFTSAAPPRDAAPNILIVLDNSANWSRNDQAWVGGKQGEAELRAIHTVLSDAFVGTNVNMGLMMLNSGAPDGGYVRYHIRNMNATNKAAFRELIGDAACTDGPNSVNGTPNCILKNFDRPSEKTNSASTRYSSTLFEVFKYFGGYTDPARANSDTPGTPIDSTHFGPRRYGALDPKADPAAYVDAGKTTYRSPLDTHPNPSCAKNFIIFIGNGYPSADDPSQTLLAGINGTPNIPAPIGNKANRAANWAKYLNQTDVHLTLGRQYINTYTIDVFNAKPDPDNQTPLLKAMAKYGGGRYFEARNEEAIVRAIREIIVEIQAVNSVFASASLPINATNRSQNENQVFIGMFRPDPDTKPRWYGNLKRYQAGLFGDEARLADKDGKEAIAATTGFVQACATSFWATDSGNYWENVAGSTAGSCVTAGTNPFSDVPDGAIVERGGAAEVVRRGNDPSAGEPFTVNRTMYTCAGTCGSLVAFNAANVPLARTGAASAAQNQDLIDFTRGQDIFNEAQNFTAAGAPITTDPRPSIHGDIAHSRPLPVNYGGTRGVVVYYGANDGTFKAVEGSTGKELWSFVAPEHHHKLKRLFDNAPPVFYPNITNLPGAVRKDYFWDGSSGIFQNLDNTKVWIFPTMRRGGRMVYGFDVSGANPILKWSRGCDAAGNCTPGFGDIGQTWSTPNVAFIKGYSGGTKPVILMGGGYDPCEDTDAAATTCLASSKGNRVYVIDADSGGLLQTFNTQRAVPADVTLIDRDYDAKVDHAYAVDTGGAMYRIDFVDPATKNPLPAGSWRFQKVAETTGAYRKFLFAPSALAIGPNVYLAVGSGDRERPLAMNYPYQTPVLNRFYMFVDSFLPGVVNLDGPTMENFTAGTDCDTVLGTGKQGWYMDLAAGKGEQTVTSSVVFGGTVFFSTNRPVETPPGTCAVNLGEARGYAVNLLNASGVIGSGALCGGARSGVFTGGGLPPSPVVGTVPITDASGKTKPISVLIGGIDLGGRPSGPINLQEPIIPIKQTRARSYWYPHGGDR